MSREWLAGEGWLRAEMDSLDFTGVFDDSLLKNFIAWLDAVGAQLDKSGELTGRCKEPRDGLFSAKGSK
jgi:hypothetical protein